MLFITYQIIFCLDIGKDCIVPIIKVRNVQEIMDSLMKEAMEKQQDIPMDVDLEIIPKEVVIASPGGMEHIDDKRDVNVKEIDCGKSEEPQMDSGKVEVTDADVKSEELEQDAKSTVQSNDIVESVV